MKTTQKPTFSPIRASFTACLVGWMCIALTSCASIVSKSSYPVTIASNPPGATFTLKRLNGMAMSTGVTPATIILSSSTGYFQPARYIVEFTNKGVTQSVPFNASINGWYFGNLLFGHIIGMLIVDPATGAMWRLDDTVIATFNQKASIEDNHGLKICTIDQVPLSLRSHLVALR